MSGRRGFRRGGELLQEERERVGLQLDLLLFAGTGFPLEVAA